MHANLDAPTRVIGNGMEMTCTRALLPIKVHRQNKLLGQGRKLACQQRTGGGGVCHAGQSLPVENLVRSCPLAWSAVQILIFNFEDFIITRFPPKSEFLSPFCHANNISTLSN